MMDTKELLRVIYNKKITELLIKLYKKKLTYRCLLKEICDAVMLSIHDVSKKYIP